MVIHYFFTETKMYYMNNVILAYIAYNSMAFILFTFLNCQYYFQIKMNLYSIIYSLDGLTNKLTSRLTTVGPIEGIGEFIPMSGHLR